MSNKQNTNSPKWLVKITGGNAKQTNRPYGEQLSSRKPRSHRPCPFYAVQNPQGAKTMALSSQECLRLK